MIKLKISIVIATRNRNELLEKTLVSLSNQTYKKYFEVLVCDDGGNSNTEDATNKFSKDLNIKYYWCEDQGGYCWAHAKNIGAEKAKADYLLFMDDDILIPRDGIEKMYQWMTRLPWRKNKYFLNPQSRLYVSYNFPNELIIKDFAKIKENHIENYQNGVTLGCTGLISKHIFNKIGGFDEILFKGLQLGDTDITKRLEGFLGVLKKTLPIQVYHLDNDAFRDKRNIIAIQRKNIAKQLIREKIQMMGFKMQNLDDMPKQDPDKKKEGFYNNLLSNKDKIDKISIILRKRLNLYDNDINYFTPHIRK